LIAMTCKIKSTPKHLVDYNLPYFILDTDNELESNPKYINFPNSAKVDFHYRNTDKMYEFTIEGTYVEEKNLGFIPLEDVVGPLMDYHFDVVDNNAKEEKKN